MIAGVQSVAERSTDIAGPSPHIAGSSLRMLDLRHHFDLVEGILRSSSDCIKVLDFDGGLVFMSEGGQRVMEIDDVSRFIGCPWPDFWQDEGNAAAKAAIAEAKAGRHASFQGMARTGKGRERWWDVAVNPIYDADGAVARILSISRDITDLKEAQAQQQFLMEELSHRVKNMLTMIKALASRTLRDVRDRTAVAAFDARLIALAAAHDVLLRQNWSKAPMREVVGSALEPHGGDPQIAIRGPDVALGPQTALHLALLLHELATNAIKYGALSSVGGGVEVTWDVDPSEAETLVLRWREHGGPPVAEPSSRGFGSRLIGMGLGDGRSDIRFAPDGLVASFRAAVDHLAR